MFMLNFSTFGRMTGQTRPKVLMLKIPRTERWDNDAELPWRRAPVAVARGSVVRMDAMTIDLQGPRSGRSQAPRSTNQSGVLHRREKVNIS